MSDTMVAERQESRQDAGRDEGRAPAPQPHDREQPTMAPRVDVIEDTTGITLLADLPGVSRDALEIHVEGDASSASYFLAAGAISGLAGGGPVRVEGVGRASIQGDVRFTETLEGMGARITMGDNWIEAGTGTDR